MNSFAHDLDLMLYLAPVIVCFFGAAVLLSNPRRVAHHGWLALCLSTLGATLSFTFCYDQYFGAALREALHSVYYIMSILVAVTVLFYFTALMRPHRLTKRYIAVFVGIAVAYALVLTLPDAVAGQSGWNGYAGSNNRAFRIFAAVCDASIEVYTITAVVVMFIRYRRFIRSTYSYSEGINLRWIFLSNGVLALLAVVDITWKLSANVGDSMGYNAMVLAAVSLVFWLGYTQGEVPAETPPARGNGDGEAPMEQQEREAISLTRPTPRQEQTKQALLEYFLNEKPYLNPKLSLDEVAAAIGAKSGYLSRLINREFNVNFYTFVNDYRLDYAIGVMKSSEKPNIGELAAAAGFRSRSVFYYQFRRRTGRTPHDYMRSEAGLQ